MPIFDSLYPFSNPPPLKIALHFDFLTSTPLPLFFDDKSIILPPLSPLVWHFSPIRGLHVYLFLIDNI